MPVPENRLLVSLHDVSPRHEAAVRTILGWLAERGLPPAQLLVVPDFHGKWPLSSHDDFCREIGTWRDRGHELVLHGYFHLESPRAVAVAEGLGARFKRRFLTAGEGEFLSLPPDAAGSLLDRGLEMWERSGLGSRPRGFIPPAWLHRPDLDPVLWDRGFAWTENHQGFRFRDGARLASPVITWASRDPMRRIGSRIYCPSAAQLHAKAGFLRLAIHPHDFDHPSLIRSIDRTLRLAMRDRTVVRSVESPQ
jgi:uncharacterized protein